MEISKHYPNLKQNQTVNRQYQRELHLVGKGHDIHSLR